MDLSKGISASVLASSINAESTSSSIYAILWTAACVSTYCILSLENKCWHFSWHASVLADVINAKSTSSSVYTVSRRWACVVALSGLNSSWLSENFIISSTPVLACSRNAQAAISSSSAIRWSTACVTTGYLVNSVRSIIHASMLAGSINAETAITCSSTLLTWTTLWPTCCVL